ncbi:hypothetical protein [Stenotrophomonas sp. SMYL8]|uniref:hypothetical protein n=1 Tax=Stenotrophomonas sp. SMYL8 TaxID=3076041 RepID=UPI002E786FE4|nr:hypothetical protein [Stenotrophomonas sp. SMYL8]
MSFSPPYPYTTPPPPRPLWPTISKLLVEIYTHKWLFLLLGTLVMVAFFWRVRYLPAMTLTDLGLVAVAIIAFSVLMIGLLVVYALLPVALLREWQAIGAITDKLSLRSSDGSWVAPTILSMGLFMVGGAVALALLATAVLTEFGEANSWALALLMLFGVASMFAPTLLHHYAIKPSGRIAWSFRLVTFSTGLYLFFFPFLTLVVLGTHSAAEKLTTAELVVGYLSFPLVHFLFLSFRALPLRQRLIAASITITYLLLVAGTAFEALDRAAAVFQLGLRPHQNVVVSSEGCRVARAAAVIDSCSTLEGPGKVLYEIHDVFVLNRLGSHMVIAEPSWTPKRPSRSVPIPIGDVVTWYTTPPSATPLAEYAPRSSTSPPKIKPKRKLPKEFPGG